MYYTKFASTNDVYWVQYNIKYSYRLNDAAFDKLSTPHQEHECEDIDR